MIKIFSIVLVFVYSMSCIHSSAQNIDSLRQNIRKIIADKKATVGIAITGENAADTVFFNENKRLPMQSVFKFPIALALLNEVDKGKFSLTQKIKINKSDLLLDTWSPIRDKSPTGTKMPLKEIIQYTVALSDNVGCDVLVKLLGGAANIDSYFKELPFENISIKTNEADMQKAWAVQFDNWITARAANNLLTIFYNNQLNNRQLLSKKSYDFIWQVMRSTETGEGRLKGKLPQGTVVAHKTGTSGTNELGVRAAVNDMGMVFLPNGHYYTIGVFVSNSTENMQTNEDIIASVSKAAWDYFTRKYP